MSLSIDDRIVVGVFALNQWFEIVPNSIRIDAYEFMYFDNNVPFGEESGYEKSLRCFLMGDIYEERQLNETREAFRAEINLSPNTDITFSSPSPYAGFEFKCAKTGDSIAFPLTEIKAFRYKRELNTHLYPRKK
tara:strand:+ start:975 stop:1376 length:402 start_codon:yes stop_codon:yes gene_type:complete